MTRSLQLAHQLEGKHVLLIGAGEVALTRIPKLLPTGCKLTMIAPHIHDKIFKEGYYPLERYNRNDKENINIQTCEGEEDTFLQIYRIIKDEYKKEYLDLEQCWSIILVCIPEHEISQNIYNDCKEKFGNNQMINVADVPHLCDFYFGSNLELTSMGKLQIMISSNGTSPRFTSLIKDEIKLMFKDMNLDESLVKLGELRTQIRLLTPLDTDLKYRMAWIKKCTDIFGIQYCQSLNIEALLQLFLQMYNSNRSLTFPERVEMLSRYTESN